VKPRKALIPAAGLGTRFLPATKVVPKELLPIVDRPAIEYIVEELAQSGIEEIVFVVSREKDAIFDHFSTGAVAEAILRERGHLGKLSRLRDLAKRLKFHRTYQLEPRGLGHAVYCGREAIGDEPFVVVLPDDLVRSKTPCVRQLIDVYEKRKCSIVAVEQVPRERVRFYGIASGKGSDRSKPFKVEHVVEKPSPEEAKSNWAIIGRYVLEPQVFDALEKAPPGAIGEIQLTDALGVLMKSRGLCAVPFEGTRIDSGQPHGWLEANLVFAMDRPDLKASLTPVLRRLTKGL
jgi:UTP--glucose-1-phosphate uridylyltransferase